MAFLGGSITKKKSISEEGESQAPALLEDLEKIIFLLTLKFFEYRFGGKHAFITTILKSRQNSVN